MGDPITASPLANQLAATLCLDDAARALYEARRHEDAHLQWPEWGSPDVPPTLKKDAQYRAMAAHRLGSLSVRQVLLERVAGTLAIADGYIWPACDNRGRTDGMGDEQFASHCASRRQWYLHLAGLVVPGVRHYLELGTDTEPQRQEAVRRMEVRRAQDTQAVRTWKNRRVVPIRSTEFT